MNYAAAIGDANPLYFNDERPEGIIAPPLFPVAMTWPIIENITDYLEAEGFPQRSPLYTGPLHRAPQHPQAGDARQQSVKSRASIAAILPHRAGTHVVIRFDAQDAGGNHLFTEHIGAMMRGVQCADAEKAANSFPSVPRQPKAVRGLVGIHHTH